MSKCITGLNHRKSKLTGRRNGEQKKKNVRLVTSLVHGEKKQLDFLACSQMLWTNYSTQNLPIAN